MYVYTQNILVYMYIYIFYMNALCNDITESYMNIFDLGIHLSQVKKMTPASVNRRDASLHCTRLLVSRSPCHARRKSARCW